jgi:hypothetical protein
MVINNERTGILYIRHRHRSESSQLATVLGAIARSLPKVSKAVVVVDDCSKDCPTRRDVTDQVLTAVAARGSQRASMC